MRKRERTSSEVLRFSYALESFGGFGALTIALEKKGIQGTKVSEED